MIALENRLEYLDFLPTLFSTNQTSAQQDNLYNHIYYLWIYIVIDRPGVAGAVLQTALSLIN